ncbi:MAG: hypothetical protein PH343_10250, partial [Nitrospira sp.]|nr:hypothetical protein [Nitrospira sp.]
RFMETATDKDRFYKFVKMCISYVRATDENVQRVLIPDTLRSSILKYIEDQSDTPEHLYRDVVNRYVWHFTDIVMYEATKLELTKTSVINDTSFNLEISTDNTLGSAYLNNKDSHD